MKQKSNNLAGQWLTKAEIDPLVRERLLAQGAQDLAGVLRVGLRSD
jgi:hypothetical protein